MATTTVKKSKSTSPLSSTTEIVWQWLTYSLWVLLLGSLGFLVSLTLNYFISDGRQYSDGLENIIYVMAVTLCLLPAAYFVDKSYSRHEPLTKHGFAGVVTVLHAVLAFLVGIIAAIVAVVTSLSLATDISADVKDKLTVILSGVLIAGLSSLFFARITRPSRFERVSRQFRLIVLGFATAAIIAALVGPFAASISNRSDRLIEANLPTIGNEIQNYVGTKQALPKSLQDLTLNDDYQKGARTLIERGLVTYKELPKPANPTTTPLSDTAGKGVSYPYSPDYDAFAYELCVNYDNVKRPNNSGVLPASSRVIGNEKGYIDTSTHAAGKVCYEQTAYVYNESVGGKAVPPADL